MQNPEGLPAREAALKMLDAILRRGQTMDNAAQHAKSLPPADAALASAIVGETLRRLPDIDALIEASDRGIRLGFDGSGGAETLRKLFADRSELWDELRVVLASGGRFSSPPSFAAPYVYSNWPDGFDSFECAAVTGRNVRLRSAPKLDAPVIASVSHVIVRLLEPATGELWSRVQLGDGRTGYMWHAYVRSPIDYRALFNVIDGRWRMTAFVAGD